MDKLKMHSPDFTDENIARIAELFPNCVTESRDENGGLKQAIDFDQLKQELSGNIVEGPQERYHLDWPGKREALLKANAPIAKTLRPSREESVDFDTTKNLYIEGDNLDALKLLQETYLGKVKMIYIDPPYNTGNDFIYEDDFAEDKDAYFERSMQKDEEGNRLVVNAESNGRFHSDWLTMLYPRLKLSRSLLSEDGCIFISIDDNEVHNLRRVCDEIFGESNYVQEIIWEKKFAPQNDAKYFSLNHETILLYAKNKDLFTRKLLPMTDEQLSRYKNPDNDPRGIWQSDNLTVARMTEKDRYEIVTPNGNRLFPTEGRSWVVAKEKFLELHNDNRIWYGEQGGNTPRLKRFLHETQQGRVPISIFKFQEVGHTQEASQDLKALFDDKKFFDYPKPIKLLKTFIYLTTGDDDLILDFFSGSATTAHSTMELNADDGGKRKFILVQLAEEIDDKSDAYKSGYRTITEIGKERIRRAGKKIKEEAGLMGTNLDIGFRVLKVDTSNMKDVYYSPDSTDQQSLLDQVTNIKEDRTPEDLLFQVLLDWGVDLTLPITKETIAGKTTFFVDTNALAACFDDGVNDDLVKAIAERHPLRAVFKDNGYDRDDTKINVAEIFKLISPNTELKSL